MGMVVTTNNEDFLAIPISLARFTTTRQWIHLRWSWKFSSP